MYNSERRHGSNHCMHSDEGLQVQTYEETDAYAVSTAGVRSGIKMTCTPHTHMRQELLSSKILPGRGLEGTAMVRG